MACSHVDREMRWLLLLALALAMPATIDATPRLGGIRGLVTGGGHSRTPPHDWIDRGPLANMRVQIEDIAVVGNDHVATTNNRGRYARSLKPGEYRLRILTPGPQCTHDKTDVIVVKPGKLVDVNWSCEFFYK